MKSSKPHGRLITALLLSLAVVLSSGCIAVAAGAAGAGTVAYLRGELDATLPHHYQSVAGAADLALQQMQFSKISEKKDALVTELVARTALDKRVVVTIDNTGENLTRVRLRVGLFGDETISRSLLDRIKANL